MASLEYGMYGFNVINPNGETSQRIVCRLDSQTTPAIGGGNVQVMSWSETVTDEYGMVVPSGTSTFSCIRTPVAGLYKIKVFSALATTTASDVQLDVYVNTQAVFTGGNITNALSGASYRLGLTYISMPANSQSAVTWEGEVYLEKDKYIIPQLNPSQSTLTPNTTRGASCFTVELISTEQANKGTIQTV